MKKLLIITLLIAGCSTSPDVEDIDEFPRIGNWQVMSETTAEWVGAEQSMSKLSASLDSLESDTLYVDEPGQQSLTVTYLEDPGDVMRIIVVDSTLNQNNFNHSDYTVRFRISPFSKTHTTTALGIHGTPDYYELRTVMSFTMNDCDRSIVQNEFWMRIYEKKDVYDPANDIPLRAYQFDVAGYLETLKYLRGCPNPS